MARVRKAGLNIDVDDGRRYAGRTDTDTDVHLRLRSVGGVGERWSGLRLATTVLHRTRVVVSLGLVVGSRGTTGRLGANGGTTNIAGAAGPIHREGAVGKSLVLSGAVLGESSSVISPNNESGGDSGLEDGHAHGGHAHASIEAADHIQEGVKARAGTGNIGRVETNAIGLLAGDPSKSDQRGDTTANERSDEENRADQ